MIYSVETSARIMNAMRDVELANNGYIFVAHDAMLAKGLREAGYTVVAARDAFGLPAYRVFTAAGYAAEIAEARMAWRKTA